MRVEISGVKKIEITDDSVVIQMNDNESQLRAKDAVENHLNVAEQNVVIACQGAHHSRLVIQFRWSSYESGT